MWRALGCMNKNSKTAFERVKPVHNDSSGAVKYVPYYDESEEEVSSDDEGSLAGRRWCTVRRSTHVNLFGDAAAYVDLEYAVKKSKKLGTIEAVVRHVDVKNGALHFRLRDDSQNTSFELCSTIMSTRKNNSYKVMHCFL